MKTDRSESWKIFPRLASIAAISVLFCSLFACENCFAQFPRVRTDSAVDAMNGVIVRPPREWKQPLVRAQRAIDEKSYGEAVQELSRILAPDPADDLFEYSSQDYFVESPSDPKTFVSLRTEAQRLLGSLPPAGRDEFELIHGAQAKRLLDEAVADGDIEKLSDVAGKYFHTKSGYQATIILGRFHLDRGRYLAAALCFKRVAAAPAIAEFEPELSILLATSWLFSGHEDAARETLIKLRDSKAVVDGVRMFEDDDDAVEWLTSLVGAAPDGAAAKADEWMVHRGNATRNGVADGGLPLNSLRWRIPTANDPAEEELVAIQQKSFRDSKLAAIPSVQPLAVGGVVLMRDPSMLLAVDFKTGKRIWQFPWEAGASAGKTYIDEDRSLAARSGSRRELELKQRLWEDAAFGQVTTDGEAVFLLHDLGYANQMPVRTIQGFTTVDNSHNKLVAVSLAREGALMWQVGGKGDAGDNDEPKLANTFFLGAPLPIMGSLYALAETQNEIRLVVLDSATGQLQWYQQLAQVENYPINRDSPRRLAGASPSFADGVLVCPTSNGAIVGVDVTTRSLLWVFPYRTLRPQSQIRFGQPQRDSRRVGERWADGTVTIAEGKVIATPVQSEELICLDLLTGKPAWTKKRQDNDMLYVACVHQGQAIVVGNDNVRAHNLKDGETAWTVELDSGVMPSGRGYYSDGHYFLPTTDAKVVKFDLEEGKAVGASETGAVLGNLICYQGEVISHGPDWLATFYQDRARRESVLNRLKQNPEDAEALAGYAEILLQDGDVVAAIETIRKAHELKPSDAHSAVLIRAVLAAMEDDFSQHEDLALQLEPLVKKTEYHQDFLRLKSLGQIAQKRDTDAFDTLMRMAELKAGATEAASMLRVSPKLDVRGDRWIRARVSDLLHGEPQADKSVSEQVQTRLEDAIASADSATLRNTLRLFGDHPQAGEVRLALARKNIENESFPAAELLLTRLSNQEQQPELRAASVALRAKLFERAGQPRKAAGQYRRLATDFADVVCEEGKSGQQLVAAVADDSPIQQWLTQASWETGRVDIARSAENVGRPNHRSRTPIEIRQRRGGFLEGASLRFDPSTGALHVQSPDGIDSPAIDLNSKSRPSISHARVNGNIVLLTLGFELIAIDLSRAEKQVDEAILWRHDLTAAIPDAGQASQTVLRVRTKTSQSPWGITKYWPVDANNRLIGATGSLGNDGVCVVQQSELVCLHPLTGEKLWKRDGLSLGSDIFGDDQRMFVVGPTSTEAEVYSTVDGSLLGKRPTPRFEERIATSGTRVLSGGEDGGELTLSLNDIWEEKQLFHRRFPLASKAFLLQPDAIAVLQPSGELMIVSLETGDVLVKAELEPVKTLLGLVVLQSHDQYLVAVNRPITMNTNSSIRASPGGVHSPMINGKLYAIDRTTGEHRWREPVVIDQYALPLDQAPEVPVLTLLRHMTPTTRRGPRIQTSLTCIDKRTGRTLIAKDDIPSTTFNYKLEAKPAGQSVVLTLPGQSFQFKFTSEPWEEKTE